MGLEVYHALHCVNAIRMYIFPDNYEFREKKSETELHKRRSHFVPGLIPRADVSCQIIVLTSCARRYVSLYFRVLNGFFKG